MTDRVVNQQAKNLFGTDLAFPLKVGPNGDFEIISGESNLRQAIKLHISAILGEVTAHRDFGTRMMEFVLTGSPYKSWIEQHIKHQIMMHEYRLQECTVQCTDVDPEGKCVINIDYLPLEYNHPENLIYPYFLKVEQGL